jgi:formylglycine-generating enzyme required for sulfatase activity/predicted Ser/Thr protein kinase
MLNATAIERSAAPHAGAESPSQVARAATVLVQNLKAEAAVGFLPPGTQLDEYRVERVLGHGGFGVTYLARDTHLDKVVAIKEYLPAELAYRNGTHVSVRSASEREAFDWGLQQFIKEARTLARFTHPHLVPVHRFFTANSTAYFVMEYVEGETFASLLKREAVNEERLLAVLRPVMLGLEAVHRAGILHRDIKPENILLRSNGSPVLIDFGAARLSVGSMTRSTVATLTAGYAPLEQYCVAGNQGPWTDVYALGAVAYRVISGRKPPEAVCRVHDDPLVPASVSGFGRFSPALLRAVDWALAVKPEDRPRTVGEWQRALLDGRGASPRRTTTIAPRASAANSGAVTAAPPAAKPAAGVEPVVTTATRSRPWSRLGTAMSTALVAALVTLPIASLRGSVSEPPSALIIPAAATEATPADTASAAPVLTAAIAPVMTPVAAAPVAQPAPAARIVPEPKTELATAAPATAPRAAEPEPLSRFRDCPDCPQMVVLPTGSYDMGAPKGQAETKKWEGPVHRVTLRKSVAMGRTEVTNAQWQACVRAGACAVRSSGAGADLPVVNVSHTEARAYAAWLTRSTGRNYRLPSEAEWEYAARAGTRTARFWGAGAERQCVYANAADRAALAQVRNADAKLASCSDGHATLAPVASLRPNWFDLYDTAGNVWEWTADCWRDSYAGAPADGRAVDAPHCAARVMRGGSWRTGSEHLRSAARSSSPPDTRGGNVGFRVVAG